MIGLKNWMIRMKRSQKGSSSIEAALIVPMILVMHFFIVGGFIWYAETVHFEVFWNAQDLKLKDTIENGSQWLKSYGEAHSKKEVYPFVGKKELKHRNTSFTGPLYETIRLARMGEKILSEELSNEKDTR